MTAGKENGRSSFGTSLPFQRGLYHECTYRGLEQDVQLEGVGRGCSKFWMPNEHHVLSFDEGRNLCDVFACFCQQPSMKIGSLDGHVFTTSYFNIDMMVRCDRLYPSFGFACTSASSMKNIAVARCPYHLQCQPGVNQVDETTELY